MTPDEQYALVAEAALAPSVHNVQPARWRFAGDGVILFEDATRRLPAGDPTARDAATSLGAAAEGLAIALSRSGRRLVDRGATDLPAPEGDLLPQRRFGIEPGTGADPLGPYVADRRSHRGTFAAPNEAQRRAAAALAADDLAVVSAPDAIARIAVEVDRAGHRFFRDDAFRRELLSWMRLRRRDPRWAKDGLNADAMAMSRVEAVGAGLVMGPLFRPLDRVGLAAPLTAEAAKIRSATAIALFHRPHGEARFDSGRAFYRAWLRIAAAGLGGAVMAALADDPAAAASVAAHLPAGRELVSAWRVGPVPADAACPRARIAVDRLIV
ncbi:hypothetical protein [Sphingomonas sp. VNH70]|uniref:hypothetical protein n=1 Tax=Sphingomonas silueang TaxID=3156617 RepID=UPI0032B60DF4